MLAGKTNITFVEFLEKLKQDFDKDSTADLVAYKLLTPWQGKRSVADFAVDFLDSGRGAWLGGNLRGVFLHG